MLKDYLKNFFVWISDFYKSCWSHGFFRDETDIISPPAQEWQWGKGKVFFISIYAPTPQWMDKTEKISIWSFRRGEIIPSSYYSLTDDSNFIWFKKAKHGLGIISPRGHDKMFISSSVLSLLWAWWARGWNKKDFSGRVAFISNTLFSWARNRPHAHADQNYCNPLE